MEKPWQDKERMEKAYHGEELSTVEISEEFGCSPKTVSRWLNQHDIETRDHAEQRRVAALSKEARQVLEDEEEMRRLYIEEGLSLPEIAKRLDCNHKTVDNWLINHGIEKRSISESRTGQNTGENHPRWSGGTSSYRGPNWPQQRERRLEFDDYQCVLCRMSEAEHRNEYSQGLDVHHIQPADSFDDWDEANKRDNLITLCKSCHIRVEHATRGD